MSKTGSNSRTLLCVLLAAAGLLVLPVTSYVQDHGAGAPFAREGRSGPGEQQVSRGSPNEDLFESAMVNDIAGATGALERGASVNARDKQGDTPLMAASSTGAVKIVELLVLRGANVNLQGKDGFTALICAAMEGEPVITQFLIKNQANLEARCTCHGATSLSLALRRGRNETVRTLIEAGANIETKDKYGWTPLTWGAAFGRYESVKLLLEKGAKANHRDSSGKTALDWAREQGHTEVVALLQNRTQRDDPDE